MVRFLKFKTAINLLLVGILLLACTPALPDDAPAPELEPSQTPLPSATIDWFPATATKAPPTHTPSPQEPSLETPLRGEVLITDDFSDDTLWQTQNLSDAKINYEPNALSFAITGNKTEATSLSQHVLPAEFYLEFTIETALCSDGDQYGIIFWRNSRSGTWRLWANCQGELMVDRVLPDGATPLVNWQVARKLAPASPSRNVFSIHAEAGNLDFFVNGTYQFSLQSRTGLEGALGVFARSGGNTPLTIRFSELIISKPQP